MTIFFSRQLINSHCQTVGPEVLVVVRARAGKEFPDMRQNEREIRFIRMGDTVRTAGQLKGEPPLSRGP